MNRGDWRSSSLRVTGVDGCRLGWCAVSLSTPKGQQPSIDLALWDRFKDVLDATQKARVVAVDIPIGLPDLDQSSRECDRAARKLLSTFRRSSVFPTPPRDVVRRTAGLRYSEAVTRARAICGRGLSLQTFSILEKVRDVDRCLTPTLQHRIFEFHPELSFWSINGQHPIATPKATHRGFIQRKSLLTKVLSKKIVSDALSESKGLRVGRDDVLDALAGAYSAMRIVETHFEVVPQAAQFDERGLRMQIAYPVQRIARK